MPARFASARRLAALAAVCAVALAAQPARADLIVNGGFETGNFDGWDQFGDFSFNGVDDGTFFGPPPEGAFQAYFGPIGDFAGISQTVATTAGQTYHVEFLLANLDGGTPNAFEASFDGLTLLSYTDSADFGYTPFSFDIVASGASATLSFSFRHDPSYWLLDAVDVTLVPTAIPEPASVLLLAAGAAGLAARRRLRRA